MNVCVRLCFMFVLIPKVSRKQELKNDFTTLCGTLSTPSPICRLSMFRDKRSGKFQMKHIEVEF
ncbi:CLUMA_CG004645, isoform A [Clunio marinus]|uniref:CLUMA_CG004645, isoform A n=1 Tax=Clunio marinus TaxID=568069 RepID=A0A1J1HUB2_9DIPT|nr:CLUMA_CG004645, isoform A [Clunio marinus]